MKRRLFFVFLFAISNLLGAEGQEDLESRIRAITKRAEFKHSHFGVHIYSLSDNKVLYSKNADRFFVPGSVTKIVTEAAVLGLLGPDYRFKTSVYRSGEITEDGTLNGDLILVASGDPNLSNRVQGDTIAFENNDHSYGMIKEAGLVSGDPLSIIQKLARQVREKGIRKITGQVYIDAILFPEGQSEGGTGVVISPIAINDNVIDVIVSPGKAAGETATVSPAPASSYISFKSQISTVPVGGRIAINFSRTTDPDGKEQVVVSGSTPAGIQPRAFPYNVPEPSRFARIVFSEALKDAGVDHRLDLQSKGDYSKISSSYKEQYEVATHTSPPMKEDVKLTLKVSQNLHAAMMPYVLGAVLSKKREDALEAGFQQIKSFLQTAKLDVNSAVQSDGAGGDALFTPEFIVQLLIFMSKHKTFEDFYAAFPVLGRDGTLADVQKNSVVAGKLRAKTGTHVTGDLLNLQYVVNGKGLAGYMDTSKGKRLAFAIFVNRVPIGDDLKALDRLSETLTEIISAAY